MSLLNPAIEKKAEEFARNLYTEETRQLLGYDETSPTYVAAKCAYYSAYNEAIFAAKDAIINLPVDVIDVDARLAVMRAVDALTYPKFDTNED